jgi:hypothetical protein
MSAVPGIAPDPVPSGTVSAARLTSSDFVLLVLLAVVVAVVLPKRLVLWARSASKQGRVAAAPAAAHT